MSTLHTPEFFRTNARYMEGPRGDFEPLKDLIDILSYRSNNSNSNSNINNTRMLYVGLNEVCASSWDEDDVQDDELCESLSVCLFDIGEFVRNYPNGRVIANKLFGAKNRVMQYVNHPRLQVQEQALLCASKLLLSVRRHTMNMNMNMNMQDQEQAA